MMNLSFFRNMFSTFLKTFRQISDPKILKALGWATLLTLLAVVLAVALGVSLMDSILDFFSGTLQSWFGKGENWFRGFAQFLGGSTRQQNRTAHLWYQPIQSQIGKESQKRRVHRIAVGYMLDRPDTNVSVVYAIL